jgi:hypothetical protein
LQGAKGAISRLQVDEVHLKLADVGGHAGAQRHDTAQVILASLRGSCSSRHRRCRAGQRRRGGGCLQAVQIKQLMAAMCGTVRAALELQSGASASAAVAVVVLASVGA